jgi:hypothetical protein
VYVRRAVTNAREKKRRKECGKEECEIVRLVLYVFS